MHKNSVYGVHENNEGVWAEHVQGNQLLSVLCVMVAWEWESVSSKLGARTHGAVTELAKECMITKVILMPGALLSIVSSKEQSVGQVLAATEKHQTPEFLENVGSEWLSPAELCESQFTILT